MTQDQTPDDDVKPDPETSVTISAADLGKLGAIAGALNNRVGKGGLAPGGHRQLSLFVEQDRRMAGFDGGAPVRSGAVKLGGSLRMRQNLHPGEELTVTVATSDGTIVAAGVYAVGEVTFKPLELDGTVIGTERIHSAKPTDDDALKPDPPRRGPGEEAQDGWEYQ